MVHVHVTRRAVLQTGAAVASAGWLNRAAYALADQAERAQDKKAPAKALILLWMQGGPSQLETFDPHPGTRIGGDAKAIETSLKGVQIAADLPLIAEQMDLLTLLRAVTTKEGDHERGTYLMKTGFRPDPTVVHPSLGAIVCHPRYGVREARPGGTPLEIPRHVSILPSQWPARGGDLGDEYDAFKTFDPIQPVPDVRPQVAGERFAQRLKDLDVVERAFSRKSRTQSRRTLHRETVDRAVAMMHSAQLKAFDVTEEPQSVRARYGDSPFGRGCLAARRLVEAGVNCVEVTLEGWDTHFNNHEGVAAQNAVLDPAFAALLADLQERGLYESTLVLWAGEFGRTPRINGTDGRDHWPTGFSVALGGAGIRRGFVLGQTSRDGERVTESTPGAVAIADVYATVLAALGIDHEQEYESRSRRPIRLSDGEPIAEILL
jgi:hypothetical protein